MKLAGDFDLRSLRFQRPFGEIHLEHRKYGSGLTDRPLEFMHLR